MPSGPARPRGLLIPGLSVVVLAAAFACSGVQHDESAEHVPSPQPGEKQPKLVASEDAFDFGEVPLGVRVEHSFVLRNEGDAPLEIGANPEVKLLEGC